MIDYHVHTPFCNHAVGSMEQYVQQAIAAGLQEICFLDHLSLLEAGAGQSMAPDEVPFYFQAGKRLARQYREQVKVKVGLEIDFDPDRFATVEGILTTFDFDVITASIHFVDGRDIVSRKSDWARGQGNMAHLCERYVDLLEEMIAQKWVDAIGHLDLMKKFGNRLPNSFTDRIADLIPALEKSGKVVEVNTSGWDHPAEEMYPSPYLLEHLFQTGVPVTIGSDAHAPAEVARHFNRAILEMRRAGYRKLTAFDRRRPVETPLDPWPPEILNTGA